MSVLTNKIVFITGASSGIGRSCAEYFAREGARLLLAARRQNLLNELADQLKQKYGAEIHYFKLDVSKHNEVATQLEALPEQWKDIDILINNAGLARGFSKLHEGSIGDWEEMINTNIKGLLFVTRYVVPGMVQRGSGHVINIGSIAGKEVYPNGNVYCATKHAVDAITKGLRIDLLGTPIRVSTVDPGMVETDFSYVRFHGDKSKANAVYEGVDPLTADDIADAVLWVASRPPRVQIAEITMFPTAQRSSMHISRK